jgi:hypothetical protein
MMFPESDLKDVLEIERKQGYSAAGVVYDDPASVACAWEFTHAKITDSKGSEIVASAFSVLPAKTLVEAGDRIKFDGKKYEVIKTERFRPDGVEDHVEIYVKEIA